jgi:hypothetical protein
MEAAKAQNWAVESQEKKIKHYAVNAYGGVDVWLHVS